MHLWLSEDCLSCEGRFYFFKPESVTDNMGDLECERYILILIEHVQWHGVSNQTLEIN